MYITVEGMQRGMVRACGYEVIEKVPAILMDKEFINITRMIIKSILWKITDDWVI